MKINQLFIFNVEDNVPQKTAAGSVRGEMA